MSENVCVRERERFSVNGIERARACLWVCVRERERRERRELLSWRAITHLLLLPT